MALQKDLETFRASWIEWPAVLKCSMIGKQGKFFYMLQRCSCGGLSALSHIVLEFLLNILLLNLEVAYYRRSTFNVLFAYFSH